MDKDLNREDCQKNERDAKEMTLKSTCWFS